MFEAMVQYTITVADTMVYCRDYKSTIIIIDAYKGGILIVILFVWCFTSKFPGVSHEVPMRDGTLFVLHPNESD